MQQSEIWSYIWYIVSYLILKYEVNFHNGQIGLRKLSPNSRKQTSGVCFIFGVCRAVLMSVLSSYQQA